jgi:tetratricopeptide (TPR) repeat protein/DNA-binding winged helix-turn-helix (wHTH) protein
LNSDLLQGFHLGDVLIEPLTGRVSDGVGSRHLPPKAVEVLLCLAREPGELVTREALLDEVWGAGLGSQEALGHAVSEIRHALDDHPEDPRFIQTLPKRGYRLLVEPIWNRSSTAPVKQQSGFWQSLLRHGVVQASAAYLVAGWLLIQVADATFEDLGLPVWSQTFITFTVVGGFPILVLLTWFFDFIGGRIEQDSGKKSSGFLYGLERNYLAIFVAYIVAAGGAATYQALVGFAVPQSNAVVQVMGEDQADLIPIVENSIAVLQLLNIDGDPKAQAFSEGLGEDILDGLARIPGLRVSARGDSWSLPPNASSTVVKRRLRVANYIEGSVRISDDTLRVVIQLIDTESGFHLFSRSFEIDTAAIGEMQKTVTSLVIANLQLAVDPSTIETYSYYSSNRDKDAFYSYMLGREAYSRPRSVESLSEAIEHFDQALIIDEHYPAAHAGRCSAFVAFYILQQDTSNIGLAEAACDKALAAAPRLPMVMISVASLYRYTGRAAEAEALYRELLQIDEQNVAAMKGLALIHRRAQRFDEAELLMRKAIDQQPGNWVSINALGNMYFRMGRYVEAIGEYRKVVFLDANNYVTLGNLASVNLMIGDFASARDALERSIAIEENGTFYSNLGIAHYYLGDYPEAVAAHRRSVEFAPNSSASWLGLADALFVAGEHDEAGAAYRYVIELTKEQLRVNSEDIEGMTFLAWSSAMTGSFEDALALIDRAVAADPADPYSHYFRALILLQHGDTNGALDSIEDAMDYGYPVAMLAAEPILKELKTNSRFVSLLTSAIHND